MNIVGKHDRTRACLLENTITNYRGTRSFPVEWIDVPKNGVVSEFVMDPPFLTFGYRSIRRPEQSRPFPCCALDCLVGAPQLAANAFLRHLAEIGMRPT